MRLPLLLVPLALLLGCSDFECPNGEPRVDGMCLPSDDGPVNPEPKTKPMHLACDVSLAPQAGAGAGWGWLIWELTVDPTSIPSGERFGVEFKAIAVFPEFFVKQAQILVPGGVTRVQAVDLRATVHIRRGADDPERVLLTLAPIEPTCQYDAKGNAGVEGDDFPTCSEENDNPDGSNDGCIGLGGAPSSDNPCARFIKIPTSSDCAPGGVCEGVVYDSPGVGPTPQALCELNGFCVTGPVEVPLEGSHDFYTAADAGYVLFGLDDVGTGAELDQTGGPNHGTWILPEADFENLEAPNGMRLIAGDLEVAIECTMAASGAAVFGVNSRDDRPSPAPDHMLISFPIQEP